MIKKAAMKSEVAREPAINPKIERGAARTVEFLEVIHIPDKNRPK
jgi:hypothetical protein